MELFKAVDRWAVSESRRHGHRFWHGPPPDGQEKREIIGEEKREIIGEEKREIIGEEKREIIGEEKREIIGEEKREIIGEEKREIIGEEKREIIGEEILNAIRFPLMSLKEFASVVIDGNILTMEEVIAMIKYFADVSTCPLPFAQDPRIGPFQTCCRFGRLVSVQEGGWYYHRSSNQIRFTVDKDTILHGVQHFGSENGKYEVTI